MKSLWCDEQAQQHPSPLAQRVYTSRLLGQEPALVLHGGGNTSVKDTVADFFGEPQSLLYVKGSGWDLATIEAAGFAPVKMDTLLKMAALDALSDQDMVKYQRAAMTDPSAPNPSVEAILHAIIPFKFVDHTHTDAVVTLTNSPNGLQHMANLYGDRVFIVPYVMPGFALAQLVFQLTQNINWHDYKGMMLMNHGLFTFADDAKTAYENTIDLVSEAEAYISEQYGDITWPTDPTPKLSQEQLIQLATLRHKVSQVRQQATLAKLNQSPIARHFSQQDIATLATKGPLTPDHVIRTKRIAAVVHQHADMDLAINQAVDKFVDDYHQYFAKYNQGETCLNPSPNYAVWENLGSIAFGKTNKETTIIEDINQHTFSSILTAEQIDSYQALSPQHIFEVEYWSLEQAKLGKSGASPVFAGQIVMVTNACQQQILIDHLLQQGANIIALDDHPQVIDLYPQTNCIGCCLTDHQVDKAIATAITQFGGIDVIIDQGQSADLISAATPFLRLGIHSCLISLVDQNATTSPAEYQIDGIRHHRIILGSVSDQQQVAETVSCLASKTFHAVNDCQINLK